MNIIDNNNLLSTEQKNLLKNCVSLNFQLGGYTSLDDILTKLNVDVFVEPGIVERPIPAQLEEAEDYWKKETDRLELLIRDAIDRETAGDIYRKARNKRDKLSKEKEQWALMPLRGLYDPMANVIKLYPEKMKQEYDGNKMDELLVSTLAHETMHAYFNRPGHDNFPYVIFVEEPLAEFGMLLYLHETGQMHYYKWAEEDVQDKKTCYRFGYVIMQKCLKESTPSITRRYLEDFKIPLNYHTLLDVDSNQSITLPEAIRTKQKGKPRICATQDNEKYHQDICKNIFDIISGSLLPDKAFYLVLILIFYRIISEKIYSTPQYSTSG